VCGKGKTREVCVCPTGVVGLMRVGLVGLMETRCNDGEDIGDSTRQRGRHDRVLPLTPQTQTLAWVTP